MDRHSILASVVSEAIRLYSPGTDVRMALQDLQLRNGRRTNTIIAVCAESGLLPPCVCLHLMVA